MTNHDRKLERERDEAREQLSAVKHFLHKYIAERDEWSAMCGCYKQERDEARETLADWENAAAHVEADHPDETHCGCVSVLRKLLHDARSERDEARAVLASEKITRNHIITRSVEVERERDEARMALKHIEEYGTEEINAAVELRQKLASALVERDEARENCKSIVDKANELIARWDEPSWKDTAPTARYINALRIAVRAYKDATRALGSKL